METGPLLSGVIFWWKLNVFHVSTFYSDLIARTLGVFVNRLRCYFEVVNLSYGLLTCTDLFPIWTPCLSMVRFFIWQAFLSTINVMCCMWNTPKLSILLTCYQLYRLNHLKLKLQQLTFSRVACIFALISSSESGPFGDFGVGGFFSFLLDAGVWNS